MFHTRLCNLLEIKYPILQGAMGVVGGPNLAAAASNAGGLGILATWGISLEQLRNDIRKTRSLTNNPFGVNIVPLSDEFTRSRAKLITEEGVKIVTTGRGDPTTPVVNLLKEHGCRVLPVVPTVRHALRMEAEGADAVIASGNEAGGHVGAVATLPLVPQVVDAVKIPVIAAGGIGDARGFVAALGLGACGIQMGTRFLASHESMADLKSKQRILEASEEDSVVSALFTGKTVRMLRTAKIDKFVEMEKHAKNEKELKSLMAKIRQTDQDETGEVGVVAGQISGMIETVESTRDIIHNIIKDATLICKQLGEIAERSRAD